MKISPIMSNSYNNVSFSSCARIVKNKSGSIIYRNTTTFFRNDLDWNSLCMYIKDKYKNTNKVNLVCYACSDGSEPMSLAMLIKENFGNDFQKFFPIVAKDVDDVIIRRAKSCFVNMDIEDIRTINNYTNNNIRNYFKFPRRALGIEFIPALINPWFKKGINYSVADIKKDCSNIPSDNTLLFFRNVWPYLADDSERMKLIKKIKSQFSKNCAIVIGNFDNKNISTHNLLLDAGLKESGLLKNVYELG